MESGRAAIKASLIAKAEKYNAESANWAESVRDDHLGKVVRTHLNDGNTVVHTTVSFDGVMPEEFKKFTDNYMENVPKTFTEQNF